MGITTKTSCFHCASDCRSGLIELDGHSFCCDGCRTVYQLFAESGNPSYYQNRVYTTDLDTYGFLDNFDIARSIINFSSEGVNHVTLKLPAIHCSSCVYVLENLHKVHPGIIRLTVDFNNRTASIYYDPQQLSLRMLASLLDSIGYPPDFQHDNHDTRKASIRSLIIKVGIAGFCFGNIMLLSFPSYLGMGPEDVRQFGPFFNAIMLFLSVPVTFYAGREFLVGAFKSVIRGKIHIDVPIALGIVTLFLRSAYEIVSGQGEGYLDSLSGLVFFLLIGRWFQARAYDHLSFDRDYRSYFPLAVSREVANGETIVLPLDKVEVGHTLYIRHNEIIPADAVLLSASACIDYSFVTGENRPVTKHQDDFLFAGGRQTGGAIRVRVTKPCSQSYLTELWNNPVFSKTHDGNNQLLINRISEYFTWTILAIAACAGFYWSRTDPARVWEIVSAVLIVACPCALALATPFTNGNTLRIFGRNKLYLRNTNAAERLARIDTIVLDKTGTITTLGTGRVTYHGSIPTPDMLLHIGLLARQSSHPASRLIANEFPSGKTAPPVSGFHEHTGKGVEGVIDGRRYQLGSARWITGSDSEEGRIYVSADGTPLGYFILGSQVRKNLRAALGSLRKNYPIIILSGDDTHDRELLAEILGNETLMHFNMSPYDKLEYIKQLQSTDNKILMIGDGLNDAGALKQSDLGIAVSDDVSQFAPSSDGIIDGSVLNRLGEFMRFSRKSRHIVIASFVLSFMYNVLGLALAVSGQLTPVVAAILMPVSSVTVVAFTTFTGNYLAEKMKL